MKTKQCPSCKRTLDRQRDFYRIETPKITRTSSYCRRCSSDKVMERWRARRLRNMEKVVAHLQSNACVDCGEEDWRVLEFDHREPCLKVDAITNLVNRVPWNRVKAEMEKCEIRCANCHRRKTQVDFGHYAYLNLPTGVLH
jgi:ribosomal protein S27AE